jgi:hypothetical protein
VVLNCICSRNIAVLELQIENVRRTDLPMFAVFPGHCARTSALALCPLGSAEGRELLQICCLWFLRCRDESGRLDCVVVMDEVVGKYSGVLPTGRISSASH